MSVNLPPDELGAVFDLHGVRFELRPRAERSLAARLLWSGLAGVAGLAGVWAIALLAGVVWSTGRVELWMGGVGVWLVLWWGALLALSGVDHARQGERLQVRVGEGWLIVRHTAPPHEERVDLAAVRGLRLEGGPRLLVQREQGEDFVLPMRGHDLRAAAWVAEAIDAGARDARRGDRPAPAALLALRLGATGPSGP